MAVLLFQHIKDRYLRCINQNCELLIMLLLGYSLLNNKYISAVLCQISIISAVCSGFSIDFCVKRDFLAHLNYI